MRSLLGGKGSGLAEMTRIGLPVPPGFTITTEVCTYYYQHKRSYPPQLARQIDEALSKIEKAVGKELGGQDNPLLISVRSGARDSMPGMMDTILNLGMNDTTVDIIAAKSGNPKFAWDSYRRFLQMYGDVVMGVQKRPEEDHEPFESVIEGLKDEKYGNHHFPDTQLSTDDFKELVTRFKALIRERTGKDFPQVAKDQLWGSIGAVFGSWNNDRAIVYRRKYGIPHEWGTAVNVQTMVFGNMGETSATGVAFTRDPATGEKVFYGEYLINAQGEDVVAGVRTPIPVSQLSKEMPEAYQQLLKVRELLEKHFRDMQDLEFTIEDNRLYILQTRNGKRTGLAAIKIAVDMVKEKLISKEEALLRIPADSLSHVLAPIFDRESARNAVKIATGLPAGPGAASGRLVLRAEEAVLRAHRGERVLLVRIETSPEDLRGMIAAETLQPDKSANYADYALLMQWADKCRKLDIRTNSDTPEQVENAIGFGAEGIGLCRTEHMFFEGDRIDAMREMILARNADDRKKALAKLLPYQKEDFIAIFRKLEGLPATIRLLDPPLHEFLPHDHAQQNALASNLGIAQEEISKRVHELHEFNPMLGHRGCRLGIVYPEISEMQARAIFEAAAQVQSEGIKVRPEVMIPLVGFPKELRLQIEIVNRVAREVAKQHNTKLKYLVGTMIEIPRAALAAEQIAEDAEFFSFGTNDLTQTALGMSRDDSGSFLPAYLEHEIIAANPFASIDQEGVGELMKIARDRARKTRKGIKLGICGEHGGDPKSVKFCHAIGLDYVSCSPFRVPIARLAAAQAALEERK
jgi:pyruvate,orthophosphate dikinase